MDELEQTLREILTPQKVAAYLDVKRAISTAGFSDMDAAAIMLDLGTIVRGDQVPESPVCQSCCFDKVYLPSCFVSCRFGEIYHFSEEVRKNLHPQTAKSLENL